MGRKRETVWRWREGSVEVGRRRETSVGREGGRRSTVKREEKESRKRGLVPRCSFTACLSSSIAARIESIDEKRG